jgi:hypothetical protein
MISEQEILNASILIVDDQEAHVQLLGEMRRSENCLRHTWSPNGHSLILLIAGLIQTAPGNILW